ncbi:MAG TPA: polymer-forming cytoskeletal protein [Rubrivivax sp.]|nr:polymer-forming cytoskeletal protein [Burkholderiales bacterium]HNU12517.1 polymer-forming cytoskeletal protein [Rubrivivax sp.]
MWPTRRKAPPIRSLIGEGAVLHGDFGFVDGIRVDGEVHGNVLATSAGGLVVISEKARIHGEVKAAHVIINGEVHGPVHSTELLELQPKARVVGDVSYQMLEMHAGAVVDGELKPLKPAERPALVLAASNDA